MTQTEQMLNLKLRNYKKKKGGKASVAPSLGNPGQNSSSNIGRTPAIPTIAEVSF